jgi:hypothetical protein
MKVHLERTGGIAGLRITRDLDSANLSEPRQAELSQLVTAAHVFDLPPSMRGANTGADRFQYKLTVETEEQQHSLEFDESATPETLRSLLRWIMANS